MSARVVVAGGGPAGLAAAAALARGGVATTLLEAGAWGRPKVCGEFLSPDAASVLDALGAADAVRALDPPAIDAVRVTVARRGRVAADAGWRLPAPGLGVSR